MFEILAKRDEAIKSGDRMKMYDYNKAIKRIKEVKPREASLGMLEDWCYTAEVIYEKGKFVFDLSKKPMIAGIRGSIWATPTLEMDGVKEECWVYE